MICKDSKCDDGRYRLGYNTFFLLYRGFTSIGIIYTLVMFEESLVLNQRVKAKENIK